MRMIRQIGNIFLAAMLFMATTGFTIHKHYCMGDLIETSVLHAPDFCCGEGSDCCKNESETFQLEEDFLDFVQVIDFQEVVIDLPEVQLLFEGQLDNLQKRYKFKSYTIN